MYASLVRAVLDDSQRQRAGREVQQLRDRHPRASRDELAERLIRRAALQCAAAGGLLAGPAAFFGAVPFGADLTFQAVTIHRLVLGLASLYGAEVSAGSRAAGVAGGFSAGIASELVRQGLVRVLRRTLPRRPGLRTAAGALAGGALGYAAAIAVGRLAGDAFRGRRRLFGR